MDSGLSAKPPNVMSIATKTGDNGTTALMFGRRVSKTHPRIVANGAIDELNAALGLARSHVQQPELEAAVLEIQKELVTVMGEIAVDAPDTDRYQNAGYPRVCPEMVDRLTARIDFLEKSEKISFKHWATPGASKESAWFDHARTICRRAEREVAALAEKGVALNPSIIPYLNRLSDLCWLTARWIETKAGV